MHPETREPPVALEKIPRGSSPEKFVNTKEKKNKKPNKLSFSNAIFVKMQILGFLKFHDGRSLGSWDVCEYLKLYDLRILDSPWTRPLCVSWKMQMSQFLGNWEV